MEASDLTTAAAWHDRLLAMVKKAGVPRAPEEDFDAITNRPLGPIGDEHEHDWGYDRSICAECDAQHYFCMICGETEECS